MKLLISILFICCYCSGSCKRVATEVLPPETTSHIESQKPDTLLFKSVHTIDSVKFILLKMNPETAYVTMTDSVIPAINDSTIALCVEAAFTGELLPEFKSTNIGGDYVINGVFHKGYKCKANTGFLCTVNGIPFISDSHHVEEWIDKAGNNGGTLFQQILIIQNGKDVYRGTPIKPATKNIYRAACILSDGNFAVIQSLSKLSLSQFISSLIHLGVSEALYLDMGTGWNYGWYRETSESPATKLFDVRTPYQTNWLLIKSR